MDNLSQLQSPFCPFLGTISDPEVHYRFATPANCCHRSDPISSIEITHQNEYCLTNRYFSCVVYKLEWEGPLSLELKNHGETGEKRTSFTPLLWQILLIGLIIISALILVLFNPFKRDNHPSSYLHSTPSPSSVHTNWQENQEPIVSYMVLPSRTTTPTNTPTIAPTQTPLPSHTSSPSAPTPGPLPETPFVTNRTYLIHQVQLGESRYLLADRYNTSQEVIQVVNASRLFTVLPLGEMMIILPGQVDASGLEPLGLVFLTTDFLISEFVAQYGITEDEFRAYNGLGPGEIVPAGRWVIYPQR